MFCNKLHPHTYFVMLSNMTTHPALTRPFLILFQPYLMFCQFFEFCDSKEKKDDVGTEIKEKKWPKHGEVKKRFPGNSAFFPSLGKTAFFTTPESTAF